MYKELGVETNVMEVNRAFIAEIEGRDVYTGFSAETDGWEVYREFSVESE